TKSYRELGGVRGALQKRADEIYAAFSDGSEPKLQRPKQEIVRQIFLRLVDIATTEGPSDAPWRPVRRRVPIRSFQTGEERVVLSALINEKLLVSNREKADASAAGEAGSEATAEVAHRGAFYLLGAAQELDRRCQARDLCEESPRRRFRTLETDLRR